MKDTTGLHAGCVYNERNKDYLSAIYYNDKIIWRHLAWKGFPTEVLAIDYAESILIGALTPLFDDWADPY